MPNRIIVEELYQIDRAIEDARAAHKNPAAARAYLESRFHDWARRRIALRRYDAAFAIAA